MLARQLAFPRIVRKILEKSKIDLEIEKVK